MRGFCFALFPWERQLPTRLQEFTPGRVQARDAPDFCPDLRQWSFALSLPFISGVMNAQKSPGCSLRLPLSRRPSRPGPHPGCGTCQQLLLQPIQQLGWSGPFGLVHGEHAAQGQQLSSQSGLGDHGFGSGPGRRWRGGGRCCSSFCSFRDQGCVCYQRRGRHHRRRLCSGHAFETQNGCDCSRTLMTQQKNAPDLPSFPDFERVLLRRWLQGLVGIVVLGLCWLTGGLAFWWSKWFFSYKLVCCLGSVSSAPWV